MGHERGVAQEIHQGSEHGLDARCVGDDGVGQPGEHRDPGWNGATGVDERVEPADALAAAHLDDADLGDGVIVAIATGRFEVEDAKRCFSQGRAQVIEAALPNQLNRHGA